MAWASKLKVITIFRTDSNCLKAGLTDPTSPIPKLLNCNCGPREMYPFVALADPDGRAAEAFGCNTSSLIRTFKMNCKSAPKMCKRLLTSSIVRKEAFFAAKVCSSQVATINTCIFHILTLNVTFHCCFKAWCRKLGAKRIPYWRGRKSGWYYACH